MPAQPSENHEEKKPAERQFQVKAKWGSTEGIEPIFADHMFLVQLEDHFHLTFGQTRTLSLPDDEQEGDATIQPLTTLIIHRDVLAKILTVLERRIGDK